MCDTSRIEPNCTSNCQLTVISGGVVSPGNILNISQDLLLQDTIKYIISSNGTHGKIIVTNCLTISGSLNVNLSSFDIVQAKNLTLSDIIEYQCISNATRFSEIEVTGVTLSQCDSIETQPDYGDRSFSLLISIVETGGSSCDHNLIDSSLTPSDSTTSGGSSSFPLWVIAIIVVVVVAVTVVIVVIVFIILALGFSYYKRHSSVSM